MSIRAKNPSDLLSSSQNTFRASNGNVSSFKAYSTGHKFDNIYSRYLQENEKRISQAKPKLLKREQTELALPAIGKITENETTPMEKRQVTSGSSSRVDLSSNSNLTPSKATEINVRPLRRESMEKLLIHREVSDLINKENTLKNNTNHKTSVFKHVYQIRPLPESLPMNRGFTKTHLFDVFLDKHDKKSPTKTALPSIIDLYDKAHKLNLIEKHNPTTVKSFHQLLKDSERLKYSVKPKYDVDSKSLVFDRTRVRRMGEVKENFTIHDKIDPSKKVIHQTPQ